MDEAISQGWDGPGQGSAELTYFIDLATIPATLSASQVVTTLEAALAVWADVVDIQFSETSQPILHDSIDFRFIEIDGPGGKLAQGYQPFDVNPVRIAGDVEFDVAESWEFGNAAGATAYDLMYIAVHELGHAIGLNHSTAPGSVMQSTVSSSAVFSALSAGDVDAALALYAPAVIEDGPPGDLNGDGCVTFGDFLVFQRHFGQPGSAAEGDLNGDGMVSFADFLVLQRNFGSC